MRPLYHYDYDYIIMTMPNRTFYFTQANLDNLLSEENPNGTLNMVLANHYVGRIVINPTELAAKPEKMKRFEELKTKYPPLEIKTEFPQELESGGMAEINIPSMREQTIAPPEYGA